MIISTCFYYISYADKYKDNYVDNFFINVLYNNVVVDYLLIFA